MAKRYVVSLGIMMVTALASLLITSMLTYLLKWQADKALVGIVVTYILAGFAGGYSLNKLKERACENDRKIDAGRRMIEAAILCSIFMFLSIAFATMFLHIPFHVSGRLVLIWLLITSSNFGGMLLL